MASRMANKFWIYVHMGVCISNETLNNGVHHLLTRTSIYHRVPSKIKNINGKWENIMFPMNKTFVKHDF